MLSLYKNIPEEIFYFLYIKGICPKKAKGIFAVYIYIKKGQQ